MEKIVEFTPAFDKRDPNPHKNYGIHCVEICMILKGVRGAVQFLMATGWYLPEVEAELVRRNTSYSLFSPSGYDIGYHSPTPQYDGQEKMAESCAYLDGKPCYYDGSCLAAEPVLGRLIREGHAAVWEELEEKYKAIFGELE